MFNENSYKSKMTKTLDVFSKELSSLRTGRANSNMLDLIKVDVYGQSMPINQLGTITTPEPPFPPLPPFPPFLFPPLPLLPEPTRSSILPPTPSRASPV